MTPDKPPVMNQFLTDSQYLAERLSRGRPPRLSVRIVMMNLAEVPGRIAQVLSDVATAAGDQMQTAFKQHTANMKNESHAVATQLTFAEINKLSPHKQVELILQAKHATIVSEAVMQQHRIAPIVQAALIEHCKDHTTSMRTLAARPDATLDTLSALMTSKDQRTRVYVAAGIGSLMKIDEPDVATAAKKAAVFEALVENYESDYSPYMVPVCRSAQQLERMFDKTSKVTGMIQPFVDNPYTSDTTLTEISISPTIRIGQFQVAENASQMLEARLQIRESNYSYSDMDPR